MRLAVVNGDFRPSDHRAFSSKRPRFRGKKNVAPNKETCRKSTVIEGTPNFLEQFRATIQKKLSAGEKGKKNEKKKILAVQTRDKLLHMYFYKFIENGGGVDP